MTERIRAKMFIRQASIKVQHKCRGRDCDQNPPTKTPAKFRNWKNALRKGWVYTKDPQYLNKDYEPGGWLCPDCVEVHISRKVGKETNENDREN